MYFRPTEPLTPLGGTLGLRGTQFERHCFVPWFITPYHYLLVHGFDYKSEYTDRN
jgi:hypothetical protein